LLVATSTVNKGDNDVTATTVGAVIAAAAVVVIVAVATATATPATVGKSIATRIGGSDGGGRVVGSVPALGSSPVDAVSEKE